MKNVREAALDPKSLARREGFEPPVPRFGDSVWGPERTLERREVSFSCPLVPF